MINYCQHIHSSKSSEGNLPFETVTIRPDRAAESAANAHSFPENFRDVTHKLRVKFEQRTPSLFEEDDAGREVGNTHPTTGNLGLYHWISTEIEDETDGDLENAVTKELTRNFTRCKTICQHKTKNLHLNGLLSRMSQLARIPAKYEKRRVINWLIFQWVLFIRVNIWLRVLIKRGLHRWSDHWFYYQLKVYFTREAFLISASFLSTLLLLSLFTVALIDKGVSRRGNSNRGVVTEQNSGDLESQAKNCNAILSVSQNILAHAKDASRGSHPPNPASTRQIASPTKKHDQKVTIVVKGLVENASVYLNRKRVRPPIVINSAQKTAVVRARAKGYIDFEKRITLDQSQVVNVDFYPKRKTRRRGANS